MVASIAQKSAIYLRRMIILDRNVQGEGQSYANFLFYILIS